MSFIPFGTEIILHGPSLPLTKVTSHQFCLVKIIFLTLKSLPKCIFTNYGEAEFPGLGASVFPPVFWEEYGFPHV